MFIRLGLIAVIVGFIHLSDWAILFAYRINLIHLPRSLSFLTLVLTGRFQPVQVCHLQLYRLEKYAECCRIYKDLLKNTQVHIVLQFLGWPLVWKTWKCRGVLQMSGKCLWF